jgi:hypothetical protein
MTTLVTPAHAEAERRRLVRRFEAKCDELPDLLRAAVEADVTTASPTPRRSSPPTATPVASMRPEPRSQSPTN